MDHLSDEQLVDLAFDLAEDGAAHLAACPACRERQATLRRRLAQLDCLAGEIPPPEALIRATLGAARRRRWLRGAHWVRVAAAAVLVGAILWQVQRARRPARPEALTAPEAPVSRTVAVGGDAPRVAVPSLVAASAPPETEKRPFAPASAIELVTLPRREQVQLTVYNAADLTLVRERRHLVLKRGWNWLQVMWSGTRIDPTSLELLPSERASAIAVEQLSCPPRLGQLGRWLIHSEVAGRVPFELSYLTSGLSWRASYHGTLAPQGQTLSLRGYVHVTNRSGEDYENAEVRLVLGEVQVLKPIAQLAERVAPYGRPDSPEERKAGAALGGLGGREGGTFFYAGRPTREKAKRILQEGLSEYQLYTIEGRETITDGWSERLALLDVPVVAVTERYRVDAERFGAAVQRFLRLRNGTDAGLGKRPLPEGTLRLYRRLDAAGHLRYEGSSVLPYVPVGQEADLLLGRATRVTVTPRLSDFEIADLRFDPGTGDLAAWRELRRLRLDLRNGRSEPVTVEFTQRVATPAWEIQVDRARWGFETLSHDRFRFTVNLPANTRRTLPYTLRTEHEGGVAPAAGPHALKGTTP